MGFFDFKTVLLLAIGICSVFTLATVALGAALGSRPLVRRILLANCAMAACLTFRVNSPAVMSSLGYALVWTLWSGALLVFVSVVRQASGQTQRDPALWGALAIVGVALLATALITDSPQLVALVATASVVWLAGMLVHCSWQIRQPGLAGIRLWMLGTFFLWSASAASHFPVRLMEYLRGETAMGHQALTYVAVLLLWVAANVGLMMLVQMRLLERVSRLALTDELTGAFNRRGMREHLSGLQGTNDALPPGAVVLVDIDHFKRINDQWGHDMGDRVLRWFSFQLQAFTRQSDFLTRMGGEEFAIFMVNCSVADATERAKKICAQFTDQVLFDRDGESLRVTASFGVAAYSGRQATLSTDLQRADEALYAAKDSGRATVRVWNPVDVPARDPFDHGLAPASLVI